MGYDIARMMEHRARYLKDFKNVGFLGIENHLPRASCEISRLIEGQRKAKKAEGKNNQRSEQQCVDEAQAPLNSAETEQHSSSPIATAEALSNLASHPPVLLPQTFADSKLLKDILRGRPECNRLFITGEGGIGKTEFTRFLALHLAFILDRQSVNPVIPIWFDLKCLSGAKANLFIRLCQDDADWLKPMAIDGHLIFILDGLDELAGNRNRFEHDLKRLINQYPKCAFILAGRPGSLRSLRAGGLFSADKEHILQPLSMEDIHRYIKGYFEYQGKPERGTRLYDAVRRSVQKMLPLLQQPFLLAITCQVFENPAQKIRLPEDPGSLVAMGLTELIRRRRRDNLLNPEGSILLATDTCLNFLSTLAAHCVLEREAHCALASNAAIDVLKNNHRLSSEVAEVGLSQLAPASGVLIRTDDNCYRFTNRIVMEYLAARWIARYGYPGRASIHAEGTTLDDSVQTSIASFYGDFAWSNEYRELLRWLCVELAMSRPHLLVFLGNWLTAHLLPQLFGTSTWWSRDDMQHTLLYRFLDLLSTISLGNAAGNAPNSSSLFDNLQNILPPKSDWHKWIDSKSIASLPIQYRQPYIQTLQDTLSSNVGFREAELLGAIGIGEPTVLNALCANFNAMHGFGLGSLARAIATNGTGITTACNVILKKLEVVQSEWVNRELVGALAKGWAANPKVGAFLCDRLKHSIDHEDVLHICDAILRGWPSLKPVAFEALSRALDTSIEGPTSVMGNSELQMIISLANAISEGWSGDAAACDAICRKLKSTWKIGAIRALSMLLAQKWPSDSEAATAICNKFNATADIEARSHLASALAIGWPDYGSEVGETLCAILNTTDDEDVVAQICKTISSGFPEYKARVRRILCKRVANRAVNTVPFVRTSVNILASDWSKDPTVGRALLRKLTSSRNSKITGCIATALATSWSGIEQVVSKLCENLFAAADPDLICDLANALSRGWAKNRFVEFAICRKLATFGDQEVKEALAEALRLGWTNSPDAGMTIFCELLFLAPGETRSRLASTLKRGWPAYSEAARRTLLRDLNIFFDDELKDQVAQMLIDGGSHDKTPISDTPCFNDCTEASNRPGNVCIRGPLDVLNDWRHRAGWPIDRDGFSLIENAFIQSIRNEPGAVLLAALIAPRERIHNGLDQLLTPGEFIHDSDDLSALADLFHHSKERLPKQLGRLLSALLYLATIPAKLKRTECDLYGDLIEAVPELRETGTSRKSGKPAKNGLSQSNFKKLKNELTRHEGLGPRTRNALVRLFDTLGSKLRNYDPDDRPYRAGPTNSIRFAGKRA